MFIGAAEALDTVMTYVELPPGLTEVSILPPDTLNPPARTGDAMPKTKHMTTTATIIASFFTNSTALKILTEQKKLLS
jgi:hypothetical protein